jgi:3-methyladenine DNA glycosylase AlkD
VHTVIKKEIHAKASSQRAEVSARFFKTKPGEYGAGDIFIGLTVPGCRLIAKKYSDLSLSEIEKLLASKIHEERLIALLILVAQYQSESQVNKTKIFKFYLSHTQCINNWDLVDVSADKIIGDYLYNKPLSTLKRLASSKNLWEKRIAIIATFNFIKKGQAQATYTLVSILMNDQHDLIHKACGWMLREAGKRVSSTDLKTFLKKHLMVMPRTMLRYAIEHFPETERRKFLTKP